MKSKTLKYIETVRERNEGESLKEKCQIKDKNKDEKQRKKGNISKINEIE